MMNEINNIRIYVSDNGTRWLEINDAIRFRIEGNMLIVKCNESSSIEIPLEVRYEKGKQGNIVYL